MIWLTEKTKICTCECHREGVNIMHMMACCQFCYDTYLTLKGEIIEEKLNKIMRESYTETLLRHCKERLEIGESAVEFYQNNPDATLEELAEFYEYNMDIIKN